MSTGECKVPRERRAHLNVVLTSELEKRFTAYLRKVAGKHGLLDFGIKTKIGRMALEEWLDKHGDDVDIVQQE